MPAKKLVIQTNKDNICISARCGHVTLDHRVDEVLLQKKSGETVIIASISRKSSKISKQSQRNGSGECTESKSQPKKLFFRKSLFHHFIEGSRFNGYCHQDHTQCRATIQFAF